MSNAAIASGGKVEFLNPESFLVRANNGAAIMAKSLICERKKLHSPKKDLTILTSVGGLASAIAWSLFVPGLTPFGVRTKPR